MSKLIIPLLAVLVIAWLWRSSRSRTQRQRTPPPRPQPVLPCAHCGVHVPQNTAVHGAHGDYCCKEHLLAEHDMPARRP